MCVFSCRFSNISPAFYKFIRYPNSEHVNEISNCGKSPDFSHVVRFQQDYFIGHSEDEVSKYFCTSDLHWDYTPCGLASPFPWTFVPCVRGKVSTLLKLSDCEYSKLLGEASPVM